MKVSIVKERFKRIMVRIGNFQAQLLLTLMFVLFLAPYALLLRLFGQARLPEGRWRNVEKKGSDLDSLRRTF